MQLKKIDNEKNIYNYNTVSGKNITAELKPSLLDPVPKLIFDKIETIVLAPKILWYQWLWMEIPAVLFFMDLLASNLVPEFFVVIENLYLNIY